MNSIKVIVIDDDVNIRNVLKELLVLEDVDVVAVGSNGKEAVELYKKYKPDIILMDLMMPEYDGFYGLEQLQKICPDVKVIIISGNDDLETKRQLYELNISAFIEKPFNLKSVIEIINKLKTHTSITPLL